MTGTITEVMALLNGDSDFVTVPFFTCALLNFSDEKTNRAVLIKLKRVVADDSPPLLEVDSFGDLVSATTETRARVERYLSKCVSKPRLRSVVGRIHCDAGWVASALLKADFIVELSNKVPEPFVEAEAPVVSASLQPQAEPLAHTRQTHKIKNKVNILDPVIKAAKKLALDQDDYQSVWAEMVKLARKDNPPAPLLGYSTNLGIKYMGDKGIAYFSKSALKKRMNPYA